MSKPTAPNLPPYLNLDPEAAAKRLPDPIGTSRFAKAAAFCAKGREDLAKRGYAPNGEKKLRKFSTWEITKYLIPVAPDHLRRVLKANPDLPQGDGEGGSKWFTLEEVLALRQHFGHSGKAIGRPALEWFVRAGIHNHKWSVHSGEQRFGGVVLGLSHDQLHLRIDLVHPKPEPTKGQVVMEG